MNLDELRRAVDEVDDSLLALLKKRQTLASQIGSMKRGLDIPVYDPIREREILARLERNNAGDLHSDAILSAWREIFSASRQAQKPLRAAYLGPEGTFTQQAALTAFGSSAELVATQTIAAAFGMAAKGTVDFAVLPVENTLQGIVGETVDLLGSARQPLIVGEVTVPIHFVFASTLERLEDVRTIYSKQEAFGQCTEFLNQPALEQAVRKPATSTAEAAKLAAKDPEGASLSTAIAAKLAGAPIQFDKVENDARNKTRFLILGRQEPDRGTDGKTSVFAKVSNVKGGLVELLRAFQDNGINLTKIESRPMDRASNFETWFYIEFDGHIRDMAARDIFRKHDLVWLGSYPRSDAQ